MLYFWKEISKPPQDCTVLSGFQSVFLCAISFQLGTGSASSPLCRHAFRGVWSQQWAAILTGTREALGHRDKGWTEGRVLSCFLPCKLGTFCLESYYRTELSGCGWAPACCSCRWAHWRTGVQRWAWLEDRRLWLSGRSVCPALIGEIMAAFAPVCPRCKWCSPRRCFAFMSDQQC